MNEKDYQELLADLADIGEELEYVEVDYEPDIDETFEVESSLASIGWGTDEDYGYYGDE